MPLGKKNVPFAKGLWVIKGNGEVRLVASSCRTCGEIVFPRREHSYCLHCQQKALEDKELNTIGQIVAVTQVVQPPAGGYYKGPVPYSFGLVDMVDGVRIETHLDGDAAQLTSGASVKLDIKTLYKDEDGVEVQTYTFRPI